MAVTQNNRLTMVFMKNTGDKFSVGISRVDPSKCTSTVVSNLGQTFITNGITFSNVPAALYSAKVTETKTTDLDLS